MPRSYSKQSIVRQPWRRDPAGDPNELRRRIAIRAFALMLLALIAMAFSYLLFAPFFHPTTHLYYVTTGEVSSLECEPIPYVQSDAIRLLEADGRLQIKDLNRQLFILDSAQSFERCVAQISTDVQQSSAAVLIYTSVHVVLLDGKLQIRCADSRDPRSAPETVPIEEFLDRLASIAGSTKVVLLELRPASLPLVGSNEDAIVAAIEVAARAISSNTMWVLSSVSSGQQPYHSLGLRSSVFADSIAEALTGKADVNRDRAIDLEEFRKFVSNRTARVVAKESGGAANQTPQLISSEKYSPEFGREIVLASVPARTWWEALFPSFNVPGFADSTASANLSTEVPAGKSSETSKEKLEEQTESKKWFNSYFTEKSSAIQEKSLEELNDNIGFLPTFIGDRVKKSLGMAGAQQPSGSTNSTKSEAETTQANEIEAPTAIKSKGENSQSATAESQAHPPTTEGLPDLSTLGNATAKATDLLKAAWEFSEYLGKPIPNLPCPVDHAPHAWRAYIAYLHQFEQRGRVEAALDARRQRVELLSEIVGSYQYATTGQAKVGKLIQFLSSQTPAVLVPATLIPSVGLAELLAEHVGARSSSILRSQITSFDAAIQSSSRELFDKWIAQIPADLAQQYSEFFTATLCAKHLSITWDTLRRILILTRQFERLAFDPFCSTNALELQLEATHRLLLASTRTALDQLGSNWESNCRELLMQAEIGLQHIQRERDNLQRAWHFRNQLLGDMDGILAWQRVTVTRLGRKSDGVFDSLVDSLARLCHILRHREEAVPADLARESHRLGSLQSQIEHSWQREADTVLNGTTASRMATSWRLDALLASSMIRKPTRHRLIGLSPGRLGTATNFSDDDFPMQSLAISPTDAEFKRTSGQISDIQLSLAKLGGWEDPSTEVVAGQAENLSRNGANADLEIARSIADHYRELPHRIRNVAGQWQTTSEDRSIARRERIESLRQADLALRLLSPDSASGIDGRPIIEELWRLELGERILAKQKLVRASFQDAPSDERGFLQASLKRLAELSEFLTAEEVNTQALATRFVGRGNAYISLLADPMSNGEIRWMNIGKVANSVWLVVDYDPELVEIDALEGGKFYRQGALHSEMASAKDSAEREYASALSLLSTDSQEQRQRLEAAQSRVAAIGAGLEYPIHPVASISEPSTGFSSGQEIRLGYRVKRVGLGPDQTKIVWKLIGDGEYVRHETIVRLPSAERMRIVASSPDSSWAETVEGLVLHPWPNKNSEFKIGVTNSSSAARTLAIDLFALAERRDVVVPNGFLTEEASRDIEDRLGDKQTLSTISELVVANNSEIAWLPLQRLGAVAPLDAASPATATENLAPADDRDGSNASSDTSDQINVSHSMVLSIEDKSTKQKLWRRVESHVRHPRGYIEPTVGYDATAERINIRLKSLLAQPDGAQPIPVRGRIVPDLAKGTEMNLQGVLQKEETLSLYSDVPITAPRELTVELDVDGFPRAFVFQVPCWRTVSDVTALSNVPRIKIIDPIPGASFGTNNPQQIVKLQIDSSSTAVASPDNWIEVGWDLDRDREFEGESTVRVSADRLADVNLAKIQSGRLTIATRVQDVAIALPVPDFKSDKVNLLARIFSAGQSIWSEPVEIIVDTQSPTISGVEIRPASAVPQGTDLLVRIGVDDMSLSGIAKVEATFSITGIGKIVPTDAIIVCQHQSDSSWTCTIPTKPLQLGRGLLLVRVTDRVGNVSDTHRTSVEILSEEQWREIQQNTGREITGLVAFGDSPLSGAQVVLLNEKAEQVKQCTSDEQGAFRLSNVVVGKYRIVAVGVLKNRPRHVEADVELNPAPAPPVRLRLQAK